MKPLFLRSCKSFVDFLEKCLPLQQGFASSLSGMKKEDKKEKPPERPRWETSKPLKDIKSQKKSTGSITYSWAVLILIWRATTILFELTVNQRWIAVLLVLAMLKS